MDTKTEIFAALILNIIDRILCCDPAHLQPCPDSSMVCNGTSQQCECPAPLRLVEDRCQAGAPGGFFAAHLQILAFLFTSTLIVFAFILITKRYKIVDYVRQKFILRQNSNIVYEDVMIGGDVPPIDP